jgi:hypothetical protein
MNEKKRKTRPLFKLVNGFFFVFRHVKCPDSFLKPKKYLKNRQKSIMTFFLKKRHFFEEKVENGDGEVLFTTNDGPAQKLDE